MNRFKLRQGIVFLLISFFFCVEVFADSYRVTASGGLNVRASANQNSEVLGKLSQDDVVDVISMEGGWANINYSGGQGYVSTQYLAAVTDAGEAGVSAEEDSWDLTSWLFDSEGESTWFTVLKWIVFIVIAIVLIRFLLKAIGWILGMGLIVGGIGLVAGFILNWLDWIESGTMWSIARWGFYIGAGLGLLDAIFHFREVLDDTDSGVSSSSSTSGGLKTVSLTDESGTLYHLTQDSPYSECDYTDQFGGKWGRNSSGFYRK